MTKCNTSHWRGDVAREEGARGRARPFGCFVSKRVAVVLYFPPLFSLFITHKLYTQHRKKRAVNPKGLLQSQSQSQFLNVGTRAERMWAVVGVDGRI